MHLAAMQRVSNHEPPSFETRLSGAPQDEEEHSLVMAGLDPAIHVLLSCQHEVMDARAKPGHDGSKCDL